MTTVEAGSHSRRWTPEVVQGGEPAEPYNLGPGYLDQELLPVGLMREAYTAALAEYGSAALGYGLDNGALDLRAALAARVSTVDGIACAAEQVLVTAGTTQALNLVCTALAAPGDRVLLDPHCYDLGKQIFTDAGLVPVAVPGDADGMDPAALERALRGGRTGFVYLNPTFHNPTGIVVPRHRRAELVRVATGGGVLVVEDDAYAELGLDGTRTPPSLAALAGYEGVVRLGSFAKTLAPGLRLGWLQASTGLAERLVTRGSFVSGGCLNHTTSLAVTALLLDGGYDRHLRWLRAQLAARRDALAETLRARLPEEIDFALPGGGFFLWLRARGEVAEADLVGAASRAGVAVAPGSRFGSSSGVRVRLAYSFTSPQRLTEAASRLGAAWRTILA
ncbi:aminotransferase class I/II-fold pyridoxal phosphate-dependent enzyme [Allokutzneria sp. A3M-2-11 16]|uniref:aminotransferase class I/II-fold pyridoxal phosphate-dependent enzyme n=1 Tax=Allokutzneria sp. A3M-2-11 16 TaxID=2962043 RepID=UPI0020B72CED|nr:aminotransferase class I/II-fold pyridoxal phosphate-dependent enzyme [Allokutzneria sp. A3M-2-11 16]MCP3802847.1 aminotransferase class I/II-fold pyridoxal phosphate-dependent enzyme [Allokutzneria sp. A3M-2-11 16]